jgi:drug/metabolite transporter (DMT)-like permease
VWSTRSIRAWEEGWWEMPITVGNLIGKIIGAGEGEVTGLPSLHYSSRVWVAVAGQGLLATATSAVLWNWGLKWVPVGDQC